MRNHAAVLLLVASCHPPPTSPPTATPVVALDSIGASDSSTIATSPIPSVGAPSSVSACIASQWPDYVHMPGKPVPTPPPPAPPWANRADEGACDERHRDRLEDALLATPLTPSAPARATWDRKTPPAHAELVGATLALTDGERAVIARNGFVVTDRLAYHDYASAYSDLHRGELPVFVSVDSILHAVYASHDRLMSGIEVGFLLGRLDAALSDMRCNLVAGSYPPEVVHDLDVYLTTAQSLLAGKLVASADPDTVAEVEPLLELLVAGRGLHKVNLFGRTRTIDATQFTPRGHYGDYDMLQQYFRTVMWLSRIDLRLSANGAPIASREPALALALADLAKRTGALAHLEVIERVWTGLAGRREDVPLDELLRRRDAAGITSLGAPDVAAKLSAALGRDFPRTVMIGPEDDVAITTSAPIGARITPDTVALGHLSHGRAEQLGAADVAFMLGQDRARAYTRAPPRQLQDARDELARAPASDDLYNLWLAAIRALAAPTGGAIPSFMATPAYADLRLDSAITAYGQLRHDYLLVTAQMYQEGGCEIPDGYVEPAIETYRALAKYAARGAAVFGAIDPGTRRYFERLEKLMNVLVALSREELANHPLSADAKRFLAMIVERREGIGRTMYGMEIPVATYDGWYFDLFPDAANAFRASQFVADYATWTGSPGGVHYLGAKRPRLGVFVVDTGGAPRMMVGPVAHGFEAHGSLAARVGDADVDKLQGLEPWSASYALTSEPGPKFDVEYHRAGATDRLRTEARSSKDLAKNVVRITTERALGDVTVELLDHHFRRIGTVTARIPAGRTDMTAPATATRVEGLRIHTGRHEARIDLSLDGRFSGQVSTVTSRSSP